ncbi:ABC transporter substrate-binding protein [Hippea maritima]|uniref:ABC transporter substrate binding protein n=1 Tax=Hippea maritima (strain ATCC 700847 / DSM 10411 / MH2) TaxID=760142 RepID=F2LWI0_HIPMA|nr:ABC transporter substrate binding protein [Hippea maritima]AEA34089.1 ABC transporter substrate binding protein [Hippea maritima DSM 10411]
MRMRKVFVCFLVLILFATVAISIPARAKIIKIFMVQSYSSVDLCGMPQLKGALDTLRRAGINDNNSKIEIFFMNTKLKNSTKTLMDKVAQKAYRKIIEFKPDIVFLFDDPAFSELAPKLIRKNVSVVFSGLNIMPEDYNKKFKFMDKNRNPTANITGVYEKLYVASSIKFVEHIVGKKGKVFVLSSKDKVGRIVTRQIELELKDTPLKDDVKVFWVDSLDDIKRAIVKINEDNSVVAYLVNTHSVKSNNGKLDVFHLIPIEMQLAKKPDIAVNKAFCKRGLFGGVVLDFYAMGAQAARMALKIINGVPMSRIPVKNAQKRERVINLSRAKELNLKIPIEVLDTLDEVY